MNQVEILKPPIQSESDKKQYRLIKLPNGLKALLIHKPENTSADGSENESLSSAALKVGVGSFDDPQNIGGLAHFLEHMLFMGSEKYPGDGEYNEFINSNGGDNNAMTGDEDTLYYFEVSEKAFPEALDRFAQQFISPLLLRDSINREREAVDSEFRMSINNDLKRLMAFFKTFISDSHPGSYFDYGSLDTLKNNISDDDLYNALCDLFTKYVADAMRLCVQSKRSLDELQNIVVEKFSHLKSGTIISKPEMSLSEIVKPKFYTNMYFVKPKIEAQTLILSWYLNSSLKHYKAKPFDYIGEILRNRGDGGFIKYLKDKKLILHSQTQEISTSVYTHLSINIQLTDLGLQHVDLVLKEVFSYLLMMKETTIEEHERLFNEYKAESEVNFRYVQENDPSLNTTNTVTNLMLYDDADILRASDVYLEFDSKVILDYIDKLNERKFNITILANEHESFNKKEKYFGVEFDEIDFPEKYQRLWNERTLNPEFFLEKPNPYKATNFEIYENVEESPKYPVKIYESDIYEVWHKLDDHFKSPHGHVCIHLASPKLMNSAYNFLLLSFFTNFATSKIVEKFSSAFNAGLNIQIKKTQTGLHVAFKGYNEKLHLLIDSVIKEITKLIEEVDEEKFEMVKDQIKKSHRTMLQSSITLSNELIPKVLQHNFWLIYEKYKIIDNVKLEDIQKFSTKFFRHMKVQVLVQGNITKAQSLDIFKELENNLTCEPLEGEYELKPRGYQLPKGKSVLRMKSLMLNDENSATIVYVQSKKETIRDRCLLKLLEKMLDVKAFEQLRSKEQLGYRVGADVLVKGGVLGFSIYVSSQESKHHYSKVLKRIEVFFNETAPKIIEELADDEFEKLKDARMKLLTAQDLDLEAEVTKNWSEIYRHSYMFDKNELSTKVTKNLTRTDLKDFFESLTSPENLKKLIVQVVGCSENCITTETQEKGRELNLEYIAEKLSDDENIITDIELFRSSLFLYPSGTIEIE
ncbi:CLUMA_CG002282, isoform A [Clunio marinus]|uniref:CLUMA_CG002282, isoform A n=1 Tax=Clunio marinus TaxID=568069 RepID=A0A1J1HMA3_9DIPT|nr:CLUMA_CG002282, isoform A [Clunio marinus]